VVTPVEQYMKRVEKRGYDITLEELVVWDVYPPYFAKQMRREA